MRTATAAVLGALCCALVSGAVTATALLWPVWTAVTIEAGGARTALVPLEEGERFGITFVHSVDDLPVQDWYVVRDGTIVQESTRMRQYGAGMGNHAGDGDGRAVEGWWEVASMNRPIGDLVLRVGARPVDHRLRHPDGEVPLSRCWPRERVEIRADEVSTLARLVSAARPVRCVR